MSPVEFRPRALPLPPLRDLPPTASGAPVPVHGVQLQRIASELEDLAARSAPRLVSWQVAGLLRGLTSAGRPLRPETLQLLAARVVADRCQRLQFASGRDVKEIVQGFAEQVGDGESGEGLGLASEGKALQSRWGLCGADGRGMGIVFVPA